MKKLLALSCFLLLCLASFSQKEITVAASVDKATIRIGEPLKLTLEATFSKAHVPVFALPDSLAHFEILNRSKIDTQTANNRTTLRQTVTLTSWDSGAWFIPAIALAGKSSATKPIGVSVTFTPMQPNQEYHDIKDIIEVQKPSRTTWYWYVIGAALLVLVLLLVFPKKKKSTSETAALDEGAYKNALKELDALKHKTGVDDKAYFTALIQVFRTYLERGKGIHSFQQTTGDLSRQLATLQLPHEDLKKLVYTLQVSDFVKFAQYSATPAEREQAWAEIQKSIMAIEPMQK